MKRSHMIIGTALVALIALPVVGIADHGGFGKQRGHDRGMHQKRGAKSGAGIERLIRNAESIGLSEQQVEQLRSLQVDHRVEAIDRRAELAKAKVQLRSLMRDDESVRDDVMSAIDRVTELHGNLAKMGYDHRISVREVLTDEQRETIRDLKEERMQERRGERGERMSPRGGMRGHGSQRDI